MPDNPLPNNLNLRSEEVQEILTKPPSWIIRWGITLIFLFTCIIIILSLIIRYPDFVSAKVLITTAQPMEKIFARNSGPLEKLWVENGDTVRINQRIAIIKNLANTDDVYRLKFFIDTLSQDFQNFSFPVNETIDMILGDIGNAYIDFEKNYVEYALLRDLEPYENQLQGNRKSLQEIKIQLFDQIRQKNLLVQEYELKQIDLDRYKRLFDKGVISSQELESKKLNFIQIQKNISTMAISISQMREAISSAGQTLNETTIGQQEANTRLSRNLIQSYNNLKKAIDEWEENYVLSSSIDGIVSFQGYWGINQFINTSDLIFSILPIKTDLLVGRMAIASQNAGKVLIGQKVLIKLDNFPYQQYGMLIGYVTNISITPDNSENYSIYISLPNGTETSYGQNPGFNQELLGNAEIITENLSIAERIFFSFKDLFKYS